MTDDTNFSDLKAGDQVLVVSQPRDSCLELCTVNRTTSASVFVNRLGMMGQEYETRFNKDGSCHGHASGGSWWPPRLRHATEQRVKDFNERILHERLLSMCRKVDFSALDNATLEAILKLVADAPARQEKQT